MKKKTVEEKKHPNWILVEVGEHLEPFFEKHGGFPMLNRWAVGMMTWPEETILLEDGDHYRRVCKQTGEEPDKSEVKRGFLFTDENYAQALSKIEEDVRRTFFNLEALEAKGQEPQELYHASSLVNQLYDLNCDEGLRELTPGLSSELDAAIRTLEKYKGCVEWVKFTLESALSLRELMPEILVYDGFWAHGLP